MIPWRIRTTCHDVTKADFSQVTALLLGPNCDIINEIPKDFVDSVLQYRCHIPENDQTSSCNMPSDLEKYGAITYAACETFNLPFYRLTPTTPLVYYNMFCYICNLNFPWTSSATKCPKWEKEEIRSPMTKFSALIDFAKPANELKETICTAGEVFDIYLVSFICHFKGMARNSKYVPKLRLVYIAIYK